MYVCICNGINDKAIEQSVENGASTMRELYKELNIGSQCGKCCQCAKAVLNNTLLKLNAAQECAA